MNYVNKISPNIRKGTIIFIILFILLVVPIIIFVHPCKCDRGSDGLSYRRKLEIERFLVAEKRESERIIFHTLLDYAKNKEHLRLLDYEKSVKNSNGRVYLTFDDGPSIHTGPILDILNKYGIKATFFVVGRIDRDSIKRYKRIVKEGHTVALHSYTHNFSEIYSSISAFKKDYYAISDLIYKVTGVRSKFYRFPGGSSTSMSNIDIRKLISFLASEGVEYFDWNVMCGDAVAVPPSAERLYENVMRELVPGRDSIVLMHDLPEKKTTVEALPRIIERLQKDNYILLPIDGDTVPIHHRLYRH